MVSHNLGDMINGNGVVDVSFFQENPSPTVFTFAGMFDFSLANTDLSIGTYGITYFTYNDPLSKIRVNNNTPTTGVTGTDDPNGLIVGARPPGLTAHTNIQLNRDRTPPLLRYPNRSVQNLPIRSGSVLPNIGSAHNLDQ